MEEDKLKAEGTPKECWLDYSASQIPFPSKTKAREFLSIVTEEWGFAAIALEAKGRRGYVLLPPEHFTRLLKLWRHVWDDPLARQTKVLMEPGIINGKMAYDEIKTKATTSAWQNILQGVAVVVLAAAIIGQVVNYGDDKAKERQIATLEKTIEKLERRVLSLERVENGRL